MANSVVRLSIDSHEFDANIKRAGEALNKFFDQAKKGDRTFEVLDDDAMEVVKTFGKMETSSKSARGQISELTKGFTDLSLIYKRLTDEEKASPVGKEMAKSLGELKTRIQDTKKDLASINQELNGSKFGQFGGIIDDIGHKMGVSANLTELLTSKTALMTAGIGAAVAAIYKGTEAWAKYNDELSKQDQQTQVITGLKGSGADRMTDVMRAISDTYKVDFRQAVEAANTLMSQFGVSGGEAIQLIKDGMQGMIQGDGPKLLSMIQQYAPAFRDAGVSASQLVAVIHNSEGGIFTDQNMSAIVMGMKNIRLMTKQTSEALAKLGIDGNQMSQQLSNGSLTVFDALKQVASELKNVDSNSKTAGEVMQTVFGRQGAMAGTNLAKAIETLNTNLKETKEQTGELGDAFAELQTANEKLNTAIRDAFSYDGWDQMAIGIKTTLITALADVLDKLGKIRGFITPGGMTTRRYQNRRIEGEVKDVESATQGEGDSAKIKQQQILDKYDREIKQKQAELERARKNVENAANASLPNAASIRTAESIRDNIENEIESLRKMKEEFRQESNKVITPPITSTGPNKPTPEPDANKPDRQKTQSAAKTETQQNEAAIAKLTEEYQNLATAAKTADDAQKAGMTERMTAIQGEIKTLQERNAELKKFADEAKGVKVSVGAEGSLPQLTQQLKDLQQAQSQSLDTREWVEYQKQIDVTTTKIDILKGKWKEGQVAMFSFEEKQPDKMVFTADNKDVLTKLAEIREAVGDIEIDEKTLTVTANTAEAVDALRKIDELTIQPKNVSFIADNAEVLDKLREVNGVSIDDKTLTVTANTAEAVEALRKIDELTIQPKDVSFIADNAEVLDKLREVNGVSIDDKTLTVTANTAEAYNKVQELIGSIEGTTVSFEVKPETITYTGANMQAFLSDIKKQVQQAELGSTLYNNLTAQLADANALANLMQTAIKNGIDVSQFNPQDLWKKVFSENPGDYISDKTWQSIQEAINAKLKEMKLDQIELDFKSGSVSTPKSSTGGNVSQDMNGTFQSVQQMVGYVASINNDLKNLGVEVPEGFSKVVSIINLIQTTMAAAQAAQTISSATSSIPVVGGIIGLIAGIATSFKNGGIVHAANGFVVPGNSFSGDNVPALLDSGELILNRAQQGNLASQLTYANGRNGSQESEVLISSENIRIIMKNGAMRRGMSVAEYLKL